MDRKDLFDVVVVRGVDALPFLHSQFAADLMAIEDGQLRWSALLNPQGRVLFVVAVLRMAADDWRLLVPDSRGEELVDLLRHFVFRRKVTMAVDPDTVVAASAEGGVASGIAGLRLILRPRGDVPAMTSADLDRFVAAGLALMSADAAGRHLAHALRLDRFDAFSVKKGCYPGQEIVARTHFLGRNKRLLAEVVVDEAAALSPGTHLWQADADVGEIACTGRTRALAVLTHDLAPGSVLTLAPPSVPVTIVRTYPSQS